MTEGKIIEYIDQRRIVTSVCLKDKVSKLQLLTSSNHEASISPKRALLVSSASLTTSLPRVELVRELKAIEKKRLEYMKEISVPELWELTHDENEVFSFADLAQLAFGNHVTDDHISALVRSLFADRVYFKLKDNYFVPHSPDKVEQITKAKEAAEAREREITQGAHLLKELVNGRIPEDPPLKDKIIEVLTQLALYGKDAPDFKLGKEMFSRAGIRDMNQAHNLLVRLDIWHEDENLDLHRFNIKIDFSRPALEETDRIVNTRVDFSGREDLTGLSVFTIDGPFTRDFDDALSLEAFNGGYRLGIHITDVAPFIEPDGPLDREAFGRASSIYLPADKIPMFPPELSNNALSLVKDVKRLAITLLADFDEHWNLIGHRFAPTVVQIEKQLTYDEVNETYLEDPIYLALYRLAQALRQKRAEGGAMLIPLPEIQFEFNDDGPVRVALIEQDTPAKLMVSECMILYNWLTAKFAAEYNIPILFRGQGPPQEILPIDESRYIYYVFQQRRKLHPLSVDTVSQPHSGIGVDVYTNATSPLRRYMDLLVQRQIHSSLATQRPVYTESRLKEICMSVQQTLKDIDLMRRNQIRYWVLKHLAGRIHERLPAIVFQKLRSKYLVILTDLLFVAELPSTSTHELSPGEEITVIVRRSAPRDDIVILELAP